MYVYVYDKSSSHFYCGIFLMARGCLVHFIKLKHSIFYLTDSKKVEVLLQQMFEGEIDPEDEGPEAGMEIQVKRPRTITLDTVA